MQVFRAIKEFFLEVESTISRKMGAVFAKEELSEFQHNKLLHEFHTFFDLNKDGVLEWKDFEMAREQICKKSGWKIGTDEHTRTKAVFCDIWRYLQDDGDLNLDGRITAEEWVRMWQNLNRDYHAMKREKKTEETAEDTIPSWLERYIQYKFSLFDRAGDGVLDVDEFIYVLEDFGVSVKDARTAFLLFTENNAHKVDLAYFRLLSIEYFRSDDQGSLGNFITGRLDFT